MGVGLGCDPVLLEGGYMPPHGHPPDRGCVSQFFLYFSLDGVCLVDSDTSRKRLEALCWLGIGGWLPLHRVTGLKGLYGV